MIISNKKEYNSLFSIIGVDSERDKINKTVEIGDNYKIRSHTVIYFGVEIGDNFKTGHHVLIRENVKIGNNVLIGTNVVIDGDCIIGNNVSIQTGAYITRYTIIEDNVFIGPCVVTTNDKYMKYNSSKNLEGPIIEEGARIGANSTILPGIVIGRKAIIGSGSVITRNVPENEVWCGNPAKKL